MSFADPKMQALLKKQKYQISGKKIVNKVLDLTPLSKGFSYAYSNEFNPTVTNEFATAAFRVGHSWVPSLIKMFDDLNK